MVPKRSIAGMSSSDSISPRPGMREREHGSIRVESAVQLEYVSWSGLLGTRTKMDGQATVLRPHERNRSHQRTELGWCGGFKDRVNCSNVRKQ